MAGRLTVLTDDRLDSLRPIIDARVKAAAELVSEGAFEEFFDRTMCGQLVEALARAGAHEGTVWLLDRTRSYLIPRFNSGPKADTFVGSFKQSLRAGMISMVVATEQPICENEVHQNRQQDKTLDQKLGLWTCAMLAVPFYFAGELRGVISAVQLQSAGAATPEPPGFTAENLGTLQLAASVLSRMIEHQLMSLALGREEFR
jgi:GAF domain